MFASTRLTLTYGILALIATAANIATQEFVIWVVRGSHAITLAVAMGTVVGLVIKYSLDKRYIFRFVPRSGLHDYQTFVLYALMGLLTTAIFWGLEFGFHYIFATKEMRYAGGVIGLLIGYVTKYQLDKRFVFCEGGV